MDFFLEQLYVANADNDTVSVIDGQSNTKIKDIPVGHRPSAIGFGTTEAVYVANEDDDTVYVIDPIANKVVSPKIMFQVNPFNSGHIECDKDKLIAPLSKQFYLYDDAKCVAKPNQGFDFVSWQENLNGNSTQLLHIVPTSTGLDYILDRLDFILDLFHIKPDKPKATLNITKFGSFTANFKALPPPVPAEYIATLFTVVVTAFVGTWLTPTVIEWRKTRNQGKKLEYYHNQIYRLYDDDKLDEKNIDKLDNLRNTITNEYTKGKINKEQFDKLIDETSINYREIFKEKLNSLDSLSQNDKEKQLNNTKKNKDTYVKGKINSEQFTELKKEISIQYEEIYKKRMDSLNDLCEEEKEKQISQIQDEIEEAYSKEKITELHYNLLQKKLSNFKK